MSERFKPIDAEAVADFTLRLVGAKSPSGEEGEVAAIVEDEMTDLGYQVDVDELGNVVGTLNARPGPCVLIDAHMDTVGVTDPDAWSRSPWGERDDEFLYGRGTMDMKGPLASAIYGVAASGESLASGKVVVSATVAEELVEGTATLHVAEQVKPDFVIICEATSLRLARGQRGRAVRRIRHDRN
jgi:acetylornithine deacetylase/succinyl-diaminopimelate desuccinylase-like protein